MPDLNPVPQPHPHPDDEAVDEFAMMLKQKLAKARDKGRSGWRDPAWPASEINRQMHEHAGKGDPLDVAAYAMFLTLRGEATTAAQCSPVHKRGADDFLAGICVALRVPSDEWLARHALSAAECPPSSQVVLLSSIKRALAALGVEVPNT